MNTAAALSETAVGKIKFEAAELDRLAHHISGNGVAVVVDCNRLVVNWRWQVTACIRFIGRQLIHAQ
jgi:hypothetical protein